MAVTIAASSSTHFLWNGNPLPRDYRVVPDGALDARLDNVDTGQWLNVPLGSTVGGSVPADRNALVAALAGIVSPAVGGGGGGGGGVDPGAVGLAVNDALKGSPQPIEGQVALPSDVVNAIGSAVNAAIRGGGALPVPAGPRPQYPPGTNVSLPLAVTLANGTEQEVVMLGVALPRSIAIFPAATDTVRVRFRAEAGGDWIEPPESMAVTSASPADNKRHSLDAPIYSIGITRTVGAGTTSKVVVS